MLVLTLGPVKSDRTPTYRVLSLLEDLSDKSEIGNISHQLIHTDKSSTPGLLIV